MSEKSDIELLQIIDNRDSYQKDAIIAAIEELENRKLATEDVLLVKSEELIEHGKKEEEESERNKERKRVFRGGSSLLKPTKNYYVTPILLYINLFILLIMSISGVHPMDPTPDALYSWGGNIRHATLDGQFWRLLSCIFLHVGVLHLAFNSYALLYIGNLLEPRFGSKRFLFVYLFTGIFASIASLYINENIISVGASGAIFGLFGVFLALIITNKLNISEDLQQHLLISILLFIGYSLVSGFSQNGIDNAAHVGGIISGFIIGLIYCFDLRTRKYAIGVSVVLSVILIVVIFLLPNAVNNRVGEFHKAHDKFIENEKKALVIYEIASVYIPEEQISEICEKLRIEGIDVWKENIDLLENIDDLPYNLKAMKSLLIEYAMLRADSYTALQNYLLNNESADVNKIKQLSDSIENKIKELKEFYSL